jgi:ATP-dependent Lon protease
VTSLLTDARAKSLLLPVLPLRDVCLFPEASLTLNVMRAASIKALEVASRTGGRVLALAQKEANLEGGALHGIGTLADVSDDQPQPDGVRRIELDGRSRARVVSLLGDDTLVAEVEPLEEGDPGDEWGSAVEALARYMHAHADLRAFLDGQRRSQEPMAWVNLACQHLPITASARQKLLDADAASRCLKISRGLDALLRKEQEQAS